MQADHRKAVWDLYVRNVSYHEIAERLGLTYRQVRRCIEQERSRRGLVGQGKAQNKTKNETQPQETGLTDLPEAIYEFINKPRSREDIRNRFNLSERLLGAVLQDLRDQGKLIEEDGETVKLQKQIIPCEVPVHEADWKGDRIIRFGIASDKHFNSKYAQISNIHRLYDTFQAEGIEWVYDPGDVDEGEKMRPGHEYECYNQGADDHVAEIVKNHPRREVNGKPMKTYFISGNHDHSFIKRSGLDIGKTIAEQREDMIYLGQSWAQVNLTPTCIMELRHPADSTAYAISYKTQKMIDAMFGGTKPNLLLIGHYHKAEYLFYRNVHAIQAGCLQGQTPYMRNKGIAAMQGGWIVEVKVDDEGGVESIALRFIPFYYTTINDYLSWS